VKSCREDQAHDASIGSIRVRSDGHRPRARFDELATVRLLALRFFFSYMHESFTYACVAVFFTGVRARLHI
jgi:hypothetical protein